MIIINYENVAPLIYRPVITSYYFYSLIAISGRRFFKKLSVLLVAFTTQNSDLFNGVVFCIVRLLVGTIMLIFGDCLASPGGIYPVFLHELTSLWENYRTQTKEDKTGWGDDRFGCSFVCFLSNITLPRPGKTFQSFLAN